MKEITEMDLLKITNLKPQHKGFKNILLMINLILEKESHAKYTIGELESAVSLATGASKVSISRTIYYATMKATNGEQCVSEFIARILVEARDK